MQSRSFGNREGTFALTMSTGDELKFSVEVFAKQDHIKAASFQPVGSLSGVTLACFDLNSE